MSGTDGAIAIASVSASRQAEGSGFAGSAALPASSGAALSVEGLSGEALSVAPFGASAGRGRGSGIATRCRLPRSFGGLTENRSSGAGNLASRAVAGPSAAHSASAAMAVTIAAALRPRAPLAHFRLDFSALKFITIPCLTAKRSPVRSGEYAGQ
jgi:hypothetical protein